MLTSVVVATPVLPYDVQETWKQNIPEHTSDLFDTALPVSAILGTKRAIS